MAPEVILGRDDVDRRADVYAIGCVAFYLLTGARVFTEATRCRCSSITCTPSRCRHRAGPRSRSRRRSIALSSIVSARIPPIVPSDAGELLQRIRGANLASGWSDRARAGLVAGTVAGAGRAARHHHQHD